MPAASFRLSATLDGAAGYAIVAATKYQVQDTHCFVYPTTRRRLGVERIYCI
jgi:hypothetical protein